MTTWHADETVVSRYQAGELDRVAAASVEAHLTACGQCRRLVTADPGWLEASWRGVRERVEPGPRPAVERLLAAVGVPEGWARVVAVSPGLRLPFLLAMVAVLAFAGVVAALGSAPDAHRLFLVVAPLVPVAGVAAAYGRIADPAHEVTVAAPVDGLRLLLVRSATVLATSIGVGLGVWAVVPTPVGLGVVWLLPALALTLLTLAVASRLEAWLAAAAVAGSWVAATTVAFAQQVDPFTGGFQGLYGVAAVTAMGVMAAARDAYEREGGRR